MLLLRQLSNTLTSPSSERGGTQTKREKIARGRAQVSDREAERDRDREREWGGERERERDRENDRKREKERGPYVRGRWDSTEEVRKICGSGCV